MSLTLACAQFAPRKGKVAENYDRIFEFARESAKNGADLVAFPETCTTGYFLEGGVVEHAIHRDRLCEKLQPLAAELNAPLDLVVGFYEKDGVGYYNSAAYLCLQDGQVSCQHVYRKFFLATYGVFDESRYVRPGRELGLFSTRFGKIGLLICEDLWHSIMGSLLALQGANLVLAPSASPARGFEAEAPGNAQRYERMLQMMSAEHGLYSATSMLTGFEGGKGFTGASAIVDPDGRTMAQAPLLEDHLLMAELDFSLLDYVRANPPLLSDLKANWDTLLDLAKEE
jgi:predicted amidohydrolase